MNAAPSKPKRLKAETQAAKQMFLYGDGDGVRILSIPELARRSGASDSAISYWIGDWEAEYEEIVRSTSKLAHAGKDNLLSLPNEVLEKHKDDTAFFRSKLDDFKKEIDDLPSIIDDLRANIGNFASEDSEKALILLEKYLRLSMNRKSLIKQAVDLKNLWDEKVGLDALKAIQIAQAKAVKSAVGDEKPSPTEGNLSVFKR